MNECVIEFLGRYISKNVFNDLRYVCKLQGKITGNVIVISQESEAAKDGVQVALVDLFFSLYVLVPDCYFQPLGT